MKNKLLSLITIFITSLTSFSQTVGLIQHDAASFDAGYVLFAPMNGNTTYLMDKCGKQVQTWHSTYKPGVSVYLLPDGSLLHTGNANNTTFNAGGKGGIIEKFDWDGNLMWSYSVSDNLKCQHHDVRALPNGNVLVIAWESKTSTEAVDQGRDPALVPATLWSEQILEIQPVGATGGNVVWEWHLFDHLVQDFDNTKPNYGVVNTNPQLLNVNYQASATQTDWIHMNSIDYNAELDQILVSCHAMSEIWIIDHSTTKIEAASHSGGNSGKGGDFLYRWGNPAAYNNGSTTDQQLFKQHDAHWIDSNLAYGKQIMIFNNGLGRPGGDYSTPEIINPPVDGYNYTATIPYLPVTNSWIYNEGNPNNYYGQNLSSAQVLSNGNVLLCNGPSGIFTEIDTAKTTVWEYVNPVNISGIINQGTTAGQNPAFRCTFYPNDFVGFVGHTLLSQSIIEDTNPISANCTINSTLGIASNDLNKQIDVFPNPANNFINIRLNDFHLNNARISVSNSLGQLINATNFIELSSSTSISTQKLENGVYFLTIIGDNFQETKKFFISN